MIHANELRIGNWIIRDDSPEKVYRIEGDWEHTAYINGSDDTFDPIPLTPEILEKCGAERKTSDNGDRWICKGIKIKKSTDRPGRFMVFGNVFITNQVLYIDYLHQYQNLIFCLTGTELTIEL